MAFTPNGPRPPIRTRFTPAFARRIRGNLEPGTGLDKAFQIYERAKLQFRWEVFNVTNSVRFDPHSVSANLDNPSTFGLAGYTLTEKRVMQISGRVEF